MEALGRCGTDIGAADPGTAQRWRIHVTFRQVIRSMASLPLRFLGCDILGPRALAEFQTLREFCDCGPDILTFLAPHLKTGTVLQIGANNGEDKLGELILKYDLRAVLVEPQPDCFQLLQQKYAGRPNVRLSNVAIAREPGLATLYRFESADLNDVSLSVFTSFRRQRLEEFRRLQGWDVEIVAFSVPAVPVGQVIAESGIDAIVALVIDTEGFDLEVLKIFDFLQWRPLMVQLEHHQLSFADQQSALRLLRKNGYVVVRNKYDIFGILPELPVQRVGAVQTPGVLS